MAGCAGLPARLPISAAESVAARQSFKEMAGRQRLCDKSVDADLTVTVDSRFYRGTMNGYLQAMAPSFVKLVGINPLGQPLVALVSDGERFNFVRFPDRLIYQGDVDSEAYRRIAPAGIEPGALYYTLIGRLAPGEVRILSTGGDERGRGVWLELAREPGNSRSLVLFDPARQLIRRDLKLDEDGRAALEIVYDKYGAGECGLPGRLTAVSRDHAGELTIRLDDWRTGFPSSPVDFELELPPSFKRVKVN
ncbi:MAG: hypothetical protein RQ753_08275 [Desulfurivibrionaceae bacterium]|nr:hypothetical protein [Desulfobulbales bacterium]MDT8335681.1 hypothetical protein [Desulfurivibrionaceae bacterium]